MRRSPAQHGAILAVITEARERAGLKMSVLSRRLKEPENYIQRIESGTVGLPVTEFMRIAWAVGVRPSVLMARAERRLLASRSPARLRGPTA